MSDEWKAKIVSIAGAPVVVLDVVIERSILIDGPNLQRLKNSFEEFGQKSIVEFLEILQTVPPEAWKFFGAAWTRAEQERFALRPLAEAIKLFDSTAYWRIEGSPEIGFVGVLNVGCIERRLPITVQSAPELRTMLASIKDATQKEVDAGRMTPQQKSAVDRLCDSADGHVVACDSILREFARARAEKDRQEREKQEKQIRERQEKEVDDGSVTGDFPDGWGGDFGDVA